MNLQRRLDGLDQNKSDWVKHVSGIITNITIRSILQYKLNLLVQSKKKTNFGCYGIYGIQPRGIESILR